MKLQQIEKDHIIEELHNLGYFNTAGLTYEELKQKLAIMRFRQIYQSSSANRWF